MVVLLHSPATQGPLKILKPIAAFGWSGVGLFLVLSGFSIHFRWAASDFPHHEFTARAFARRRFFRLYPTYLAAVVVALLVAATFGGSAAPEWLFADGTVPVTVLIATQVLLIGANVVHVGYVGVAWSLALELQLYVMYASLVRRLRAIGVWRVVLTALAISIAWRIGAELLTRSLPMGQFFPDGSTSELGRLLYAQLPSRAFEWLLGVLAAEWYFGRAWLPGQRQTVALAVALPVCAAVIFRHPLGAASLNGHRFMLTDVVLDPLVGVGYLAVLASLIRGEAALLRQPILGRLVTIAGSVGIFSYSLYLIHPEMMELGARLGGELGLGAVAGELLDWGVAVLGAWVLYLLVERWFIDKRGETWILERGRGLARAVGRKTRAV